MPEPDCFLRYRISAVTRNFTSGKSDVHVLVAAARRGFKMVLFTQPSKHLCRRYMRSTERPSSYSLFLLLSRDCLSTVVVFERKSVAVGQVNVQTVFPRFSCRILFQPGQIWFARLFQLEKGWHAPRSQRGNFLAGQLESYLKMLLLICVWLFTARDRNVPQRIQRTTTLTLTLSPNLNPKSDPNP